MYNCVWTLIYEKSSFGKTDLCDVTQYSLLMNLCVTEQNVLNRQFLLSIVFNVHNAQ